MLTRWCQSRSWPAFSAMVYSLPSVSKTSKMAVKKTPRSKPLKKLSLWKLKPLSTFHPGSKKWMLTILKAINPPPKWINLPRRRYSIRTLLGLRSLDPSLLNAPRISRPRTGLGKTIKTIDIIKKAVVIVAFAAQDLQAPPQPLRLIRPISLLGMTKTATGYQAVRQKLASSHLL